MNYLHGIEFHKDTDRRKLAKEALGHFGDQNGRPAILFPITEMQEAVNGLGDIIGTLIAIDDGSLTEVEELLAPALFASRRRKGWCGGYLGCDGSLENAHATSLRTDVARGLTNSDATCRILQAFTAHDRALGSAVVHLR